MQLMLADVRPETRVWEVLDRLGVFVNEHSLEFLLGLILTTVVGGVWFLWRLRRWRKAGQFDAASPVQVGYGIILGPNFRPEEPPPVFDPRPPPWDDPRD